MLQRLGFYLFMLEKRKCYFKYFLLPKLTTYIFRQEVVVTLTNILSDLPVTMISVQPWTKLDSVTEREIFGSWEDKPLELLLPIVPEKSVKFSVHLYGKAVFFSAPSEGKISILSSIKSLFYDKILDSVSIASTTGSSSVMASINSNRTSLEFPPKPEPARPATIEGSFRIRYSGGPGLVAGYCRSAELALQMIVQPSLQIVKWDVLAAET
jgi:trafficking protein particle complex subunit 9